MNLADFSWYQGNLNWLENRTIFLTKHGSHAYGTNLPSSDLDLKGIAIAPKEYYLGFLKTFEQAEVREPIDVVIYDVRKFFKLAADCNPNIIEVLFTDESDWILPQRGEAFSIDGTLRYQRLWWKIYGKRQLFLSQKAQHTFSGYAISQLKRIQTHRRWLLNPPKAQPQRSDFGLKDQEGNLGKDQLGVINAKIKKITDDLAGKGHTKDQLEASDMEEVLATTAVTHLNLSVGLIGVVIAERKYAAAARNWDAYQTWKSERNAKRAELEAAHGYDTKHAMHLVRLLKMAHEILGQGKVLVKRPDAEELLSVRAGAWTYDQLIEFAERSEAELKVVAASSPLPHAPDRNALDRLLVETIENAE